MPFTTGPAKQPDSGTNGPPVSNGVANTADAIYAGSPLIRTAGVLRIAATNPAAGSIVGIAASDNNTAPGYNMGNQPATVGFRENIIPYYMADTMTLYRSHLVNNSDTYILPVTADIGASYGLRINTDGELVLDKNITTTTALGIVRRIDVGVGGTGNNTNYVEWTLADTAIAD